MQQRPSPRRRHLLAALAAATAGLGLAGCAGLHTLGCEISTYGEWPAGRAPGRYAFERLPSQQANAERQQALEDAARPALAAAGLQPAAAGETPDVVVQIGARITRYDRSPWDDPLWWRGGFGAWHPHPWPGPMWTGAWMRYDTPRYDREVALLLRDRASGQPLYEARATSDGVSAGGTEVLVAMFRAALTDFPKSGVNPRPVTVPLAAP